MQPRRYLSNFNYSIQRSTLIPSSARNFNKPTLGFKVSSSIDLCPPRIYTMPNSQKKNRGMGNNIEKEQLYQNNIQLKEKVNKLLKQLAETKNQVVKKDIELREKEKIIRNCLKENDIEIEHANNLEKAKESALLTLCKQKYYSMKKNYIDKCQENDILKANIKITKIKEFQIENDILNKELEKLKSLYQHCKTEYENSKNEIKDLQEFKSKYLQQHIIISNYMKKNEENNQDINKLKEKNENLQNEVDKISKKQKKLKINNCKLKISNDRYMTERKMKESFFFNNKENLKKISDYSKEVFELKRCVTQKDNEIRHMKDRIDSQKTQIEKLGGKVLNPFVYKKIKSLETEKNNDKNKDKIKLYEALLDDKRLRIEIYEKYLKKKEINPQTILKDYGYNGIINNKNCSLINRNTGDSIMVLSQLTQKNTNEIIEDDTQILALLHLFVKNMEANHVTQEKFEDKLNEIYKSFEGKEDATKEELLEPFINMFIELMNLSKDSDIEVVKLFFDGYKYKLEGDTSVLFGELTEISKNINDYTLVQNEEEEEVLNNLAVQLQKYKNELERDLKKEDVEKNHMITFDILRKIIQENNIILDDDLIEYLIYKMKVSVPDGRSMYDLNYEIILDLLKREVSENVENEKNEDVKNSEEIENDILSTEMSKTLSDFINNLDDKKIDLEEACAGYVKKLEKNGKSFEVIEKNKFFEVIEKYNVYVSEEMRQAIFECFKADSVCNNGDDNIELMDFSKLSQ